MFDLCKSTEQVFVKKILNEIENNKCILIQKV